MSIQVGINRCVCIHGMHEAVDVVVQNLLYLRGVIPETVASLMNGDIEDGDHKRATFRQKYSEFSEALRTIFKSTRRRMSSELVVLLGKTPFTPKQVYRITLDYCLHGPIEECGPHCGPLTRREGMEIFKKVGLLEHEEDTNGAPSPKMFVFVRGSRKLASLSEHLEEDESFDLPSERQQERAKTASYLVKMVDPSVLAPKEERAQEDEHVWLRIGQTFEPFAYCDI